MITKSPSNKTIGFVCVCAILWGLYWIPVHVLSSRGLTGAWASLSLALAATLVMTPLIIVKRPAMPELRCLIGSLGIGAAFALYGIAITYSDVVRVVLLFYLAPAWSTIIECSYFGRKWSWQSFLGLVLSFVGIIVLFRGELPVDGLGALGDWMALLAGICWSLGSALMFSSSSIDIRSMSYASFISAIFVSIACLVLFGGHAEMLASIDMQSLSMTIVILGLIGILYLLPVTLVTLWGATAIPPAMMSFLLTLEVIAAVASGAIFLDVRFGLVELLGTTLIIGGALSEVLRVRSQR